MSLYPDMFEQYMDRVTRSRMAEMFRLRIALYRRYKKLEPLKEEDDLIDKHFTDGVDFVTQEEYEKLVSSGAIRDTSTGLVTVDEGKGRIRVNIHCLLPPFGKPKTRRAETGEKTEEPSREKEPKESKKSKE